MKFHFSRHAKRRMNLYRITEETVEKILRDAKGDGKQSEIIRNVSSCKYPIKVVFDIQGDHITIVTVYPLKRGLQ